MDVNFSDYIDDAVRILILLNAVKERKTLKMTENKIKLYDYFLKFPCTMIGDLGVEVLSGMKTAYKNKLIVLADRFFPNIIKLSDSAIEKLISEKSNIYLRVWGLKHEG